MRVVEVGRDGDHGVRNALAEVGLRVALELLQDARADLLGGVVLVVDLAGPVCPDLTLDRADGPVDVGDGLPFGDLTDEDFTVLGERDDGGGGAPALGVRNDRGLAALEDGDCRVGGAEVDAYRTCHV